MNEGAAPGDSDFAGVAAVSGRLNILQADSGICWEALRLLGEQEEEAEGPAARWEEVRPENSTRIRGD